MEIVVGEIFVDLSQISRGLNCVLFDIGGGGGGGGDDDVDFLLNRDWIRFIWFFWK